MRKTASYRVSALAQFCTDPEEADKRIREVIGWGLQLTKRTLRMMKLEKLCRREVGTGKVEKMARRLAMEARGGRRGLREERERMNITRRKVMMIMSDKVRDAKEDKELAKIQYQKAKKEMWKVIPWESRVGAEVVEVLRGEMGWTWEVGHTLMRRSVAYLVEKHREMREEKVPDIWRGIK